MFGHKPRYEIKVTFGEISLELRQTNIQFVWRSLREISPNELDVVKNNVNVVVDELPSQITLYICLTIDIWTRRCQRTSTWFYALQCHPPNMAGLQ